MSNHSLVSVDTIISKLYREGIVDFQYSESDIIEMIGEALSAIQAYKQYEEKVKFIEVTDHQAILPEGLQEIIMVAYSLESNLNTNNCTTECNTDDDCSGGCLEDEEEVGCWSCHNKYFIPDQLYYDLVNDHINTFSGFTSYFYNNYLPLRLASSPFSPTKMLHCSNCININVPSEHEYSIQDGMIRTSFQTGSICLSYLSTPLDDNGYPMIPDMYEYHQAIVSYIMMIRAKGDYNAERTAANRDFYRQMESDWQWYCKSAKNKQLMPSNLDERERLYRGNMKMIKHTRGYYNFFGNLNDLERFNLHGGERRKRYKRY